MAIGKYNEGTGTALKIKKYSSGALRNLVNDSPISGLCARKIVLLADGDLTSALDWNNQEMGPITGLKAGDVLCCLSEVNATVDFVAYW